MKKSSLKTKLVLHGETIRALIGGELEGVVGGDDALAAARQEETGCTGVTKIGSGCVSALVEPGEWRR
jgi:hypothetical protein